MSDAAYADLALDQGADFTLQIAWADAGNSPYQVVHPIRMQARAATGQVVLDLYSYEEGAEIPEGVTPTITYSSNSGIIQVNAPNTATVQIPAGVYYYDLFVTYLASVYDMTSGTESTTEKRMKLMQGRIEVEGRVTLDV